MTYAHKVAAVMVLVLCAAACGTTDRERAQEDADLIRTYLDAGSVEEASGRAVEIAREVRERMSAEIPGLEWNVDDRIGHSQCAGLPGYVRNPHTGVSAGYGVPWTDDNWTTAARIAREVGAKHGLGGAEHGTGGEEHGTGGEDASLDRPGVERDLLLTGEHEARLREGAGRNSTVSAHGGCRILNIFRDRAERAAQG